MTRFLNRIDPPGYLNDRFDLEPRALVFPPFHFLFDNFNRKLQQYVEADLINFNVRKFHSLLSPKKLGLLYVEPFAKLTLKELGAGFLVCTTPLTLCVLVFCLEWARVLLNLILIRYILAKYFNLSKFNILNVKQLERRMQVSATDQRNFENLTLLTNPCIKVFDSQGFEEKI